jgi:hypothetical protein
MPRAATRALVLGALLAGAAAGAAAPARRLQQAKKCVDRKGWADSAGDGCAVYASSGYCCAGDLADCAPGVDSTDAAPCCDAANFAPTEGTFVGVSSRQVGFGRIVVSEIEIPNLFLNLV